MAFEQENFAPIGGVATNAPTSYSYKSTTDTLAQIEAADYFQDKRYQLEVGDYIYIQGSDSTAFAKYNGDGLALSLLTGGSTPVIENLLTGFSLAEQVQLEHLFYCLGSFSIMFRLG